MFAVVFLVSLCAIRFVHSLQGPLNLKINGIRCAAAGTHHEPRIELVNHNAQTLPKLTFKWDVHGDPHTKKHQYAGHRISITQIGLHGEKVTILEDENIVANPTQFHREVEGIRFETGMRYQFKVQWLDSSSSNKASAWSEICPFICVSSSFRDWSQAKYIAAPASVRTAPLLMKTFTLSSRRRVSHAILSVVGLGFFRVWIDGHDILSEASPKIKHVGGWTNTEKRVPYVALDVTKIVAAQKSTSTQSLVILLGEGYRNASAFKPHAGRSPSDKVDRVARVMLEIVFANNQKQYVYSSVSGWTAATETAIVDDSIYNGETFDARKDVFGIGNDGMTASTRHASILKASISASVPVEEVTGPPGALHPSVHPYVSEMERVKPINMWKTPQGTHVFDFGENSAGLVSISTKNVHAGASFSMHHAEVKQHPPYGGEDGTLYYANLRSAQAMDTFISSGNTSMYEPTFTIHGFRYVEVIGYPGTIGLADVEKIRIYANVKRTSSFDSSDATLNNIQGACIHAQESNLQSVPTDCPQRDERLGWMGDAGLSSDSMVLNFDLESFLSNFMELIADDQDSNGDVPDVVPWYRYGARPSDPAWGWAFVRIGKVLQEKYPKISTPKSLYSRLVKYVERVESRFSSAGGCAKFRCSFGDWCPPPPNQIVSREWTAGYAVLESLADAIDLGRMLNQSSDVTKLMGLRQHVAADCVKAFWKNSSNTFGDVNQSSYAFAIASKILSSQDSTSLRDKLISLILTHDSVRITSGIIGAKALLPILAEAKRMDLASDLIIGQLGAATYPSWGFMVNNTLEPATGMWELWDALDEGPGMDSRNHHMFSSVSKFIHDHIGGVRVEPVKRLVTFEPGKLGRERLLWAKTGVDGAEMKWEWVGDGVLDVDIDLQALHLRGRVVLPVLRDGRKCQIVKGVGMEDVKAGGQVRIGNGRFQFRAKCL